MGSLHGFVEFYVTCNPPLLPEGVDSVVRATMEAHPNDEVIELLYEPEIPWFKVITKREHQRSVTDFIQGVLLAIVEEDTDLLDLDHAHESSKSSDNTIVDINVVGNHPRVLPWSQLRNGPSTTDGCYGCHRYPVNMRDMEHKAVWRMLESMDGWTIDSFFRLLGSRGKVACIPELEVLLKCQISHNMAANVLYIGTHLGGGVLDHALQALDILHRIAALASLQNPNQRDIARESQLLDVVLHGIETNAVFSRSDDLICLDLEPQHEPPHQPPSDIRQQKLLDIPDPHGLQIQQPTPRGHGAVPTSEQQFSLLDADNPPLVAASSGSMVDILDASLLTL